MRLFHYAGLVLLAGGGLLAACQHDTPPPAPTYDLTGSYHATGTIRAAAPIRLFVRQAEVTDRALIGRYVARRPWLATGYFATTDVPLGAGHQLKLRFWGKGRATFISSGVWVDSVQSEVSDQLVGSFRLQRLDSVSYFTSPSAGCSQLQGLGDNLCQAQPGRRCQRMSPATGYDSYCRTRLVSMIGAHGTELYVPYLSWCVTSAGCSAAGGGQQNLFNPNGLGQLAAGDTLVLQEREIPLSR